MLFTNDQEKYQCILHQCKVIHYVLQWVGQDTLLDVILDLTMSSMYGLNQIVEEHHLKMGTGLSIRFIINI